jgi:hypothetical protein
MRKLGKVLALTSAPVVMAGMLLGGASAFTGSATSTAATLNTPSDRITFTATLITGTTTFAINSTACTVTDVETGGATSSCHLGGAGTFTSPTTTSSYLSIVGSDGVVTFHQNAVRTGPRSCATGTGTEVSDDDGVTPIRMEGSALATPQPDGTIRVQGTIEIYEAGGSVIGISCGLD